MKRKMLATVGGFAILIGTECFGALLAQEVTGLQGAGTHSLEFDLRRMPRGTYIVKVSTGSYHEARPITILK